MSYPEGRYTLQFYTPSDPTPDGLPFKRQFETIAQALSTAWLNHSAGGRAVSISDKTHVLFEVKDLKRAFDLMAKHGAERGVPPTDIAALVAEDLLTERVRKLEQFANECLGEAAVYRDLLETCYKAATKASETGDVRFLHTIMQLTHFNAPSESQAREWGKDFIYAYTRDAAWLDTTRKALESIKIDAVNLEVEDDPQNAELRDRILRAANDALIPHI